MTEERTDVTPARPSWLPNGCPPWCQQPGHLDGDRYEDRIHAGSTSHMTLTAAEPPTSLTGPGYDNEPATVETNLLQHYREAEPRVSLMRDEDSMGDLTLAEAEQLAQELLKRVIDGRTGQREATDHARPDCPAWCTEDHTLPDDGAHGGEIYGVELAAHPYTVTRAEGPATYNATMLASLSTDSGDGAPYIALVSHDDKTAGHLTADEAEQLAAMLHTLAATMRHGA